MDKPRNRSDATRRRLGEEAASWYLDQREGLSERARRDFVRWLRQSPEHVREQLAIAHLHGDLLAVAALDERPAGQRCAAADGAPAGVSWPGAVMPLRRRCRTVPLRRRDAWIIAVAASLVMATVVLIGLSAPLPAANVYAAADQGRNFALPDGTLVQLREDSAIAVRFDAHQRGIELLRGSALFDVGKDPVRPLRVHTGNILLRDVGTVFEVERHAAGATVTVVNGRVDVLSPRLVWLDQLARTLGRTLAGGTLIADLGAGQQARIDGAGGLAEFDPHADLAQATAWLPTEIRFRDRPVAEVARRFNAYTRTPLVIEDRAIAATRISGLFHARDVDAFAAYLASLPGVRVSHEAGIIRVQAQTRRSAPKRSRL